MTQWFFGFYIIVTANSIVTSGRGTPLPYEATRPRTDLNRETSQFSILQGAAK